MKNINRKNSRIFRRTEKHNHKSTMCLCAFVSLCLIFFAGCAQHQKAAVKEISTENTEISRTMKAAEDVLCEMHFVIEKADYNEGYIRTRPLAGAQFFEFWRSDNVGIDNQFLSNLHSIRRIVELSISNSGKALNIDCQVRVQRLSIPQREITSSAQAYQMFSRSSLSMQRLELNPEQEKGMTWLDLDDDTKLETEILKRVSSMIKRENQETSSKVGAVGDKL